MAMAMEMVPAVAASDLEKLQELLAAGCSPSQPGEAGWTPLHEAAERASVKSVEALLEARADVNAIDEVKNSPLHVLLEKEEEDYESRLAIAQLLVKAGADNSLVNQQGKRPTDMTDDSDLRQAMGALPFLLHDLLRCSNLDELRGCLQKISLGDLPSDMLDALNNWPGYAALHVSCAAPATASTQLLLEARASTAQRTKGQQTPLHLAAWSGSFFVVEMLIQAKADVHAYEPDQDTDWNSASRSFDRDPNNHFTALHISSQGGNIPIMRLLLEARAEVNAKDSFGQTPLHLCIEGADEDDMGPGVGVRVQDLKKRPERNGKLAAIIGPLEFEGGCTGCEDPDCGRYPVLVEEGPAEGILLKPMNVCTVWDDAIDLLLEARADVNLGSRKIGMDSSLLHVAARRGDCELARKLLAAGGNLNTQRKDGFAPLHAAIRGRQSDFVVLLLEARARADLVSGGKTALELAALNGIELDISACTAKKTRHRQVPISEFDKYSVFDKAALHLE